MPRASVHSCSTGASLLLLLTSLLPNLSHSLLPTTCPPKVSESAAATRAAGGGAPATLFFSQPTSDAVTAVLSMPHERWAAAGLADGTAGVEAYQALLAASFPTLPKEWAEAVSGVGCVGAGRQALVLASALAPAI